MADRDWEALDSNIFLMSARLSYLCQIISALGVVSMFDPPARESARRVYTEACEVLRGGVILGDSETLDDAMLRARKEFGELVLKGDGEDGATRELKQRGNEESD